MELQTNGKPLITIRIKVCRDVHDNEVVTRKWLCWWKEQSLVMSFLSILRTIAPLRITFGASSQYVHPKF